MSKIIRIIIGLILFAKPVMAQENHYMEISFLKSIRSSKLEQGQKLKFKLVQDLKLKHGFTIPKDTKGYLKVVGLKNSKSFGRDAELLLGEGQLEYPKLKKHSIELPIFLAQEKLAITDVAGASSAALGLGLITAAAHAGQGFGSLGLFAMGLPPLVLGTGVFLTGKTLKGEEVKISSRDIFRASFSI